MPELEVRAILFDMDGVLVDSFDSWWVAYNKTLERFRKGRTSREEFRKKYWGEDLKSNLKKFGLGSEAVEYCKAQYANSIGEIELFPEARKVLELLKRKFKLGLVTNTPEATVRKILKNLDIGGYFDVVITGDDVERGKPDPEMLIKACKLLNLDPGEVAIVGDTKMDVLAGRSAGCKVVGLHVDGDFKIGNLWELVDLVS